MRARSQIYLKAPKGAQNGSERPRIVPPAAPLSKEESGHHDSPRPIQVSTSPSREARPLVTGWMGELMRGGNGSAGNP